MTHARVTMIGSFPPPVGGAALVNKMVFDALEGLAIPVTRLDTSGPTLSHRRSLAYHTQRLLRNLQCLARARSLGNMDSVLYIVPDAGLGVWYSWAHILAAAKRYRRIFVHHHSCNYIEQRQPAMNAITRRLSHHAIHIFLTDGMASAFQSRYGEVACKVATNAHFVAREAGQPAPRRPSGAIRIGHLSNLCAEKGFFSVAETFDVVRSSGVDATLTLAGPILDPTVDDRLLELKGAHGSAVRHVGALNGEAKTAFYREVDLFLFPTSFKQEAAPLVVYEALASGCAVLATDRGVISEIIPEVGGATCDREADFSTFVLDYIRKQTWDAEARDRRSGDIKKWIRREATTSTAQHREILQQVSTVQNY